MVNSTDLEYDLLPESVRELADTIGLEAARRLVEAYGGSAIYVPRQVTPELEGLIGHDAAQALVDNYYSGSDRLNLPRCLAAIRAVEHRRIVAAFNSGATAGELARAHGCTERWIYRILADRRAELAACQADLF